MQPIRRLLFIATLLFQIPLFADEITIFDMRKSLAMSDHEVVHRDFYISKGGAAGLRPGMVITVKRKTPLYDSFHNRSAGDLSIPVGRIKIIHVERDLAVGRLHSQFAREDLPLLEDNFIMVGDELDLSSATTDTKIKGEKKRKAESADEEEEEPPPEKTASHSDIQVDFATQALDNSPTVNPVSGPVMQ